MNCFYIVDPVITNANSLTAPETQQLVAANRQEASNNHKRHQIEALASVGSFTHGTITEIHF
jgi:hypothetical protein